ncbi:MAG: hypothetical protein AAGH90_12475 [Pseudomonadota bacterium]
MSGKRGLVGSDGERIGTLYWINDILEVDENGVSMLHNTTAIFVLRDGNMFTSGQNGHTTRIADYSDQSGIGDAGSLILNIVGGQGDYAGADGTIILKAQANNDIAYSVDVSCE